MSVFEPALFGKLKIRNRIVYSPYIENQATKNGYLTPAIEGFYLDLAQQGVGLVLIESAFVAAQGRTHHNQLGIANEAQIEQLAHLTKAIKAEGACVGLRLMHAGSRTSAIICGEQPLSPSPMKWGKNYDQSRAFDSGDIEEIKLSFVHAAERAEEAGIELIEINGGQQFLLDQCFSKRLNKRKDDYGGAIPARMRLSLEIIAAIRERISPAIPLSFFFSSQERIEAGMNEKELAQFIKLLTESPLDMIHPANLHMTSKPFQTEETLVNWTGNLSKKPLIVEGNIRSPQMIDDLLAIPKVSLLCLDKTLYTRPNWYQFLQDRI